ncbi:MAG: PAS domain S-box protein [Chloroflexi bacterium]|nr:PAS domain S-box protein [Chloroflexota bacterium]
MSIRLKLLLLIFVAILIAGGVSTLTARSIASDTVEDQIEDLLVGTAQSKSQQIEHAIADKKDITQQVSDIISNVTLLYGTDSTGALDTTVLGFTIQLTKDNNDLIREVVIWDENGVPIFSTATELDLGSDANLDDVFSNGMGGIYIGDVFTSTASNNQVQFTSAPVLIAGKLSGAVGLLWEMTDIVDITTNRIGLGDTGEAYIVNQDGFMITPSLFVDAAAFNYNIQKDGLGATSLDAGVGDEKGNELTAVSVHNYLGDEVLSVSTDIPELGWDLIVQKGSSEAFLPVSNMTNMMIWILLAVVCIGIVGVFVLSRTITDPIVRLHRGVLEVMNGNLEMPIGEKGSDEIAKLSRVFDEMTDKLRRSHLELEATNASLENIVEQRTGELTRTNEELTKEILERKQAQQVAQESEEKYREVVERASDGICIVSEGLIKYTNPRAVEIVGYVPQEIIDTPLTNYIHADELENVVAVYTRRVAGEEVPTSYYSALQHKDGRKIDVEFSAGMVMYEGVLCDLVVVRDITERKQAEDKLRESEKGLKRAQQIAHVGSWEWNLGDGSFWLSDEMQRIHGIDDIGQFNSFLSIIDTLIHPDDIEETQQAAERAMTSGIGPNLVYRIVRPSGEVRWVEAMAPEVNRLADDGSPLILIGTIQDITERNQAEEGLKLANKRLVETAREAGMAEVATGVLHNVGNVVNSAGITTSTIVETVRNSRMGNLSKVTTMLEEHKDDLGSFLSNDTQGQKLQIYLTELDKHLSEENAKLNDEVNDLSERMQHIIEIINLQQSYSKTAGLTEIVSPCEIMEDALRINSGALIRHSVKVTREFEDLPPIPIDRHKALQILTNLISNAKYALNKNDRLSKKLTLRIKNSDDDRIRFEVADNGTGIAQEDFSQIFSYGFTTKKDGHGFGLHSGALAAKQMGGSLQVYSKGRGKGATFTLDLPINLKGDRNE